MALFDHDPVGGQLGCRRWPKRRSERNGGLRGGGTSGELKDELLAVLRNSTIGSYLRLSRLANQQDACHRWCTEVSLTNQTFDTLAF